MREAERREGAAVEYAQALEYQRRQDQSQLKKMDTDSVSYTHLPLPTIYSV